MGNLQEEIDLKKTIEISARRFPIYLMTVLIFFYYHE